MGDAAQAGQAELEGIGGVGGQAGDAVVGLIGVEADYFVVDCQGKCLDPAGRGRPIKAGCGGVYSINCYRQIRKAVAQVGKMKIAGDT